MQGFNMGRYVPPDQEGITSGNKLHNKHPLGSRAHNLRKTGGLVVRFEMPFAVWCTTCKPHETLIGQGVRFNAEKKKVGNYYSTPIYSFRMRHTPCGGSIEIRTDPKNTAYIVTEGGRKRENGDDLGSTVEEIMMRTDPGSERGKDPLARLEDKVEDKKLFDKERSRILDLQSQQNRDWNDPYERSRKLRKRFRTERKRLEAAEAKGEALKDKMSLGIELVDETEEDRMHAGMVDFRVDTDSSSTLTRVRPMFQARASVVQPRGNRSRLKEEDPLVGHREAFRNELAVSTRAAADPFLNDGNEWQPGMKRRRTTKPALLGEDRKDEVRHGCGGITPPYDMPRRTPVALVSYTSDSE